MFCFLHPASLKQHRFRQSIYRHDVHLMMATRKPTRQTHLACPFGHWKFCSLPQHIAEKNHRVWLCLVPLLHWLLNEGNKLYTYLHSSTSSHFDTSSWSSIHESTGIAKKKKKKQEVECLVHPSFVHVDTTHLANALIISQTQNGCQWVGQRDTETHHSQEPPPSESESDILIEALITDMQDW